MKITKTFAGVFLITFLIGCVLVFLTKKTPAPDKSEKAILQAQNHHDFAKVISESKVKTEVEQKTIEEIVDWKEEDDSKFKIKLLETGEGFHGDQINAKSGEIWLGLFKENGAYLLRSTKIKVRLVRDEMVDEIGRKTGKNVSVNGKNQPIFLLKKADMLREGEVKMLFYNPEGEELASFEKPFVAEYEINNKKYTLRAERIDNSAKFTLETENVKQILYSVDRMGDATWSLSWVGDLDGDGKLDVFADLNDFYNFSERRLFLSSQAEKGKLVKQVANFWTSGC